jgi:ribonucleoside-diphosphate reductase alpha chain
LIGINKAARTTCIKPEGTASLVLGTSSGIHAWHSNHYIRRVRVGKNESIYTYLKINHPELIEDDFFKPETQSVISAPVKAPKNAILRYESALDLLNRGNKFAKDWIMPGHRNGENNHNVSITVSIKDEEWDEVADWMWEHRSEYNGISVLPYDGGAYKQAPFEEITEKEYNNFYQKLKEIDLTKVIEIDDDSNLTGEIAWGGGSCELT